MNDGDFSIDVLKDTPQQAEVNEIINCAIIAQFQQWN